MSILDFRFQVDQRYRKKFVIKVKQINIIKNVGASAFEFVWVAALAFVSTPLIVHKLGVELYGVWLVAISVSGLLSQLLDPGVAAATVKYLSEPENQAQPERVAALVGASLALNLIVGLLVCLAIWGGANFIVVSLLKVPSDVQQEAHFLLLASAGMVIINFAANVYNSILQACQRFDLASGWTAIVVTLSTGLTVGLLYAGLGVWALLIGAFFSSLTKLVIQSRLAYQLLPASAPWRLRIRREELGQIMRYGGIFFFFSTLNSFFVQGQRLLISNLLGPSAVTYFAVPQSATQTLSGLVVKASAVLFPLNSALSSTGQMEAIQALYRRSATLSALLSFGLALPLIPLGPTIMRLWMGNEFAALSGQVFSILALTFAILAIVVVPSQYLFGSGRVHISVFFLSIQILIYLPTMVIFSGWWGVEGAAWALLVTYLAVIPFAILYVEQHLLHLGLRNTQRIYLPPIMVGCLCLVVLWGLNLSTVVASLLGLLVVYIISTTIIVTGGLLIGMLLGDDLLPQLLAWLPLWHEKRSPEPAEGLVPERDIK